MARRLLSPAEIVTINSLNKFAGPDLQTSYNARDLLGRTVSPSVD